jgi:hypothetical protein
LVFSLQGTDVEEEFLFEPYYKKYDERYGVYFEYHDMENLPDDLRAILEEQKRIEEERRVAEEERLRREAEEEAERLRLEAEEAERLRKEAEEAAKHLADPIEAERLRREAEQQEYEAEQARQKRRELTVLRKQYDKLYDEIARQDYIIATNSGLFGQSARNRKDAEKRRAVLQKQLTAEFPKGRPK